MPTVMNLQTSASDRYSSSVAFHALFIYTIVTLHVHLNQSTDSSETCEGHVVVRRF